VWSGGWGGAEVNERQEAEATPTIVPEFVHRFVPGTREGAPAVLLLHGTGGDEEDLLPLGRTLAPGSPLLSPRGKVLEHGMPRFFRRFAEGVFDVADLKARGRELGAFVRAASAAYRFDLDRTVAVGYSNGANIAAGLLLLEPGVLRRLVLFRAMLPFTPVTLPELSGVSVLLAASRSDPIVPVDSVQALADLLVESGARVDLEWTSAGHGLTAPEVERARAWMGDKALGRR
jgi:phospholipase/carboxylesterase